MAAALKGTMARDLDRLFRGGVAAAGDRDLLDSFLARGDESAFAALVDRHGAMVLGVCRRLLGASHDADDAFQATFLVLIRKARRVRDADRLGPWLYGVATRVATKARSRAARRKDRTGLDPGEWPSRGDDSADWGDLFPIVDSELGRLPAKHRDVLVLCLLEGSTAEEAARRLSCPLGTVKSRLARGREALRARLVGRGIAPAMALAAVAGSSWSASASPVPEALIRSTLRTLAGAATAPAGVAALTRGVAPSMLTKSFAMVALTCGGIALSGLGLAAWTWSPAEAQEPPPAATAGGPGDQDQAQSINNLKAIGLAFHNYANATDDSHFPPAAIYGADGEPKLSWRVALLPYLDQQALYDSFHLDEAWDSPHNMALIGRMPSVFATPNVPAGPGKTRIHGFVGKGAIFDGTKGVRIADITDGTSNTLLVAIAQAATTWTQPGDLPFVQGQPLPDLADRNPKDYLMVLGDGAVRHLPPKAKSLLKVLITRNGGEVFAWPSDENPGGAQLTVAAPQTPARLIQPTPPLPTAPLMPPGGAGLPALPLAPGAPAMSSTMSSSLEQRLQRLEEKVDRILQKLEADAPRPNGPLKPG